MSYTEKLIEELERDPALAEKLRKALESAALAAIQREQEVLRRDFNKMLNEQRRLAKEQKRLAKEQIDLRADFKAITQEQAKLRDEFSNVLAEIRRLADEQVKLRADFNALMEEQKRLRADFNALMEEQKRLRADFNALMEEQKRLRADFNALMEEQKRLRADFNALMEEQKRLRADFTSMLGEIRDLKRDSRRHDERIDSLFSAMFGGFGELSKFAGVSLEGFTRRLLQRYLRGMGELPKNKRLTSQVIDSEEIDIFCDNPPIVGEVTAHAESPAEVEKLLRKAKVFREKFGVEPRKFLLVLTAPKAVARALREASRREGVDLIIGKVLG